VCFPTSIFSAASPPAAVQPILGRVVPLYSSFLFCSSKKRVYENAWNSFMMINTNNNSTLCQRAQQQAFSTQSQPKSHNLLQRTQTHPYVWNWTAQQLTFSAFIQKEMKKIILLQGCGRKLAVKRAISKQSAMRGIDNVVRTASCGCAHKDECVHCIGTISGSKRPWFHAGREYRKWSTMKHTQVFQCLQVSNERTSKDAPSFCNAASALFSPNPGSVREFTARVKTRIMITLRNVL